MIELRREALEEPRFAARNPSRRDDMPCVYAGARPKRHPSVTGNVHRRGSL
jgi:hypothetical protein